MRQHGLRNRDGCLNGICRGLLGASWTPNISLFEVQSRNTSWRAINASAGGGRVHVHGDGRRGTMHFDICLSAPVLGRQGHLSIRMSRLPRSGYPYHAHLGTSLTTLRLGKSLRFGGFLTTNHAHAIHAPNPSICVSVCPQTLLETEGAWLRANCVDLVVSDTVPLACAAAYSVGTPCVAVTNFSWGGLLRSTWNRVWVWGLGFRVTQETPTLETLIINPRNQTLNPKF
jgi:hypothetical protein